MEKNEEQFNALWDYFERHRSEIDDALRDNMPLSPLHIGTRFNEAIEYALFPGGKRVRPMLTLLGAELVGGKPEEVVPAAVAVEFIHTASLIFDDLPCMDNASERRDKESLHEKFGEGLAVLAGLGFLNAAYPLVFVNHSGTPETAIQAHAEIVECVGASGMVGGQSVDLALVAGSGGSASAEIVKDSTRNLKTSALMRLALRTGAILSGADYIELAGLSRFAELLGDAYQLSDDLIDLEEDGKTISGARDSLSLAVAKEPSSTRHKLLKIVESAKRVLVDEFDAGEARSCLIQMADYLADRKR